MNAVDRRTPGRLLGVFSLAIPLFTLQCTPAKPALYVEARAAAGRHHSGGHYEQAAGDWARAAREAGTKRDRDEAQYRRASALARAGHVDEAAAAYDEILAEAPPSLEAARVAHDRAKLEYRHRDRATGVSLLEAALTQNSESGAAISTLRILLAVREAEGGPARTAEWLQSVLPKVSAASLSEWLHYELALAYERGGEPEKAVRAFLACADLFPYPQGGLWDDALYRAAQTERRLGRPKTAVALYERLLLERETSHLGASYLRAPFLKAHFELAEIYRVDLNDRDEAFRWYQRAWEDHQRSPKRGDARFQQALLKREDGASAEACALMRDLLKTFPDSRYARCAPLVCPTLSPPEGARPCSLNVRNEVAARAPR